MLLFPRCGLASIRPVETSDRVTLWFIKEGGEPVLDRTRLETRGPDGIGREVECNRVAVRRLGAPGFPWGEGKNTMVLALALVRTARWAFQSPLSDRAATLPVLRGLRPSAASRLADLAYAPDHVYWLGDMLAPDVGEDRPRRAHARLQRWFRFPAGTGRGGREVLVQLQVAELRPEDVWVMWENAPAAPEQIDAIEERLAARIDGSVPPTAFAHTTFGGRLPSVGAGFEGRDAELAHLDSFYMNGETRGLCIGGESGQGKTALAVTWLRRRLAAGNLRHGVIFAWSFSRQGFAAGSVQPPLDDLFRSLLRTLGDEPAAAVDPLALGARVLDALKDRGALVFLDGLESVLDAKGRVTDVTLEMLLRYGLASPTQDAWVLITHKRPVAEESLPASLVPRWLIPPFDHPELASFFERIGREPPSAGSRPISALELSLQRTGEVSRPRDLPAGAAKAVAGTPLEPLGPATVSLGVRRRVREKIEELYHSPARPLLLLTSLFSFDPPWRDLLAVIRQGRIRGEMMLPWKDLGDETWEAALEQLREAGLALPNNAGCVALHPEVRSVLAEDLRTQLPAWWAAGHRGLYEYYRDLPAKHWPDTVEEMAPLLVAVWHACAAGAMQESFDQVTFPRIGRGLRGFLMQELLANQWALNCLELYCPDYATAASPDLHPWSLSMIIHAQAFCLRYLDRLEDAFVVEERAWTRAALVGDPMLVLPAGIGLVRLQHIFGRLGESGPVLRALFRALIRPPPKDLEEAAALEAGTALSGMLAMVLGAKGWPVPARLLATIGLRHARSLGHVSRLTLPSYGTAWHALFLLDQGDWRRCAEADAAGEFENATARFRVTGALELVRVRWLSEAIRVAPTALERDELRGRAEEALERGLGLTTLPTMGAEGPLPRYRWWLTALRLAEGGLLAATGRVEEAINATKASARLAESNGFRLHRVDAALALAAGYLSYGNRRMALDELAIARTEIDASGYRLREDAWKKLWAQARKRPTH